MGLRATYSVDNQQLSTMLNNHSASSRFVRQLARGCGERSGKRQEQSWEKVKIVWRPERRARSKPRTPTVRTPLQSILACAEEFSCTFFLARRCSPQSEAQRFRQKQSSYQNENSHRSRSI